MCSRCVVPSSRRVLIKKIAWDNVSLSNPGIAKRLYAINSPPHATSIYRPLLSGGGHATSMKRFDCFLLRTLMKLAISDSG